MDGNWEPQQLLWKPRRIDSSNYKDTWVNLEIDNPKSNKAAAAEPANSTLEEVAIEKAVATEKAAAAEAARIATEKVSEMQQEQVYKMFYCGYLIITNDPNVAD